MLAGTREDLVALLSIPLGKAGAENAIANLENTVRNAAVTGTNAAIDAKMADIRAQVRDEADKKTKKLFYGAGVAGGIGILFALAAAVKARKCAR
jgi:homoserine dehydrogenase